MAANISNFILGFFVGAIIIVGSTVCAQFVFTPTRPVLDVAIIYSVSAGIFFAAPVFMYLLVVVSAKMNGITHVEQDVRALKRNLFFNVGLLWVAIGATVILALTSIHPIVTLVAVCMGDLAWLVINKTLVSYVTNY